VATGYDARPSGIYRFNPEMKMSFMRPNYERRMYFNAYYWTHRTDSLGFRNPEDRESAYVVLLGDSMIYGHGLEEHSTVRYHLETLLKKPIANLAAQGNSIHQEYQVLKTFGLRLKPAYVFLFFLHNDITDLTVFLTDDEMRRFLSIPVADHATPYFEIKPARQRTRWFAPFLDDLYVRKAYQFLKKVLWSGGRAQAEAFTAEWEPLPPFHGNPRMPLAMQFHLQALRKIQHLANMYNFRFINVFIYTGLGQAEPLYEGILESFCKTQGIRFVSLRDEIERAVRRGEQVFLPQDGHFSDAGTRLVARVIAGQIQESPPQ
jgi:lysophospholipase L1-like esterase